MENGMERWKEGRGPVQLNPSPVNPELHTQVPFHEGGGLSEHVAFPPHVVFEQPLKSDKAIKSENGEANQQHENGEMETHQSM